MSVKLAHITPNGTPRPERPLSERVHEELREDLLSGQIEPGARLKMDALQQRYDTSNTPLREALNRLTAEGLVTADERRGFRAAEATAEQFEDLNTFRLVVEEGALIGAIEHGDDAWEAQLVASFHALEILDKRSGRPSSSEEWRRRHKAFHIAMFAACPSPRLIEACDQAFDLGERFRRLAALKSTEPRHQDGEHEAILKAVLDRDTRLATALLRSHLLRTAAHVRQYLSSREDKA